MAVIDLETGFNKIHSFKIEDSKNQSWYTFMDQVSGIIYPVLFNKKDKNKLYRFDDSLHNLSFVMNTENSPLAIVDEHIYRQEHLRNNSTCHYLDSIKYD